MARKNVRIPVWRKLLYSLVVLGFFFVIAEFACRLLLTEEQLQVGKVESKWLPHHDVERFVAAELEKVDRPHFPHLTPEASYRVAPGNAGAFKDDPGRREVTRLLPGNIPPDPTRVLVFGGSAAFGVDVPFDKIFSTLLQQLGREQLSDPAFEVLNMGRTGWELNSVLPKIRQVVSGMKAPPAAVIIYAGNNEVLAVASDLDFICPDPWEVLHLYRAYLKFMTTTRLHNYLHGHDRLHSIDGGPLSWKYLSNQIWQPCGMYKDASFWPRIKKAYVAQHRKNIEQITAWLKKRGVLVVLVAPPVNLIYFPGSIQKQPATHRAVGQDKYSEAAARLRSILRQPNGRLKALEAYVARHPDGAIQWYGLGMALESHKQHRLAARCFRRARAEQFGVLAGLPSFVKTVESMDEDGVVVIRTSQWFSPTVPPTHQAGALFNDAMHLNPGGHKRLAAEIAEELFPLLKK